ncbi:MAG: hypothetical protein P9M06_01320 [Candidatus Saelkia tenebricola]|nr:hypothetical protein [Candidatus Saelkia tenebricola]
MFLNSRAKIFFIITLGFSIIYVVIICQKRFPVAHDTFQYLQQQYVYFNEIVQNRSLSLWTPFVAQGFVGNYHFTPQLTLLSPIFYFLGLFTANINYLYLFYFAIWFEEIFFLSGVILLSSLYYKNIKTTIFVALALLGTNIWYPQIWWNFHIYYFFPILIYCIHKGLLTKHFKYFIFSILFSILTVYGNFIYCIIFVSFIVSVYVLLAAGIYFKEMKVFLQSNIRFRNAVKLLVLITVMFFSFYYIKYGNNTISYLSSSRNNSGFTNLNLFLQYGGSIGWAKYAEIFKRYGTSRDINLYSGFLLLPFVLISIFYNRRRISFLVGLVALVVFLFSLTSPVSLLFYYLYPFGKYFRHIGLTATVFKLFLILYAGFGFDLFLERMEKDKRVVFIPLMLLMAISGFFILNAPLLHSGYFWFITGREGVLLSKIPYLILAAGIIAFWCMYRTKFKKRYLINMLLILMGLDFLGYKYSLIVTRMPRASKETIALFRPYKYDFNSQRLQNTQEYWPDNERMRLFYAPIEEKSVYSKYTTYSTIESFFYTDSAVSIYRTDFMLKSIKDYLDTMKKIPNYVHNIYRKYSGIDYPKLQVFNRLNRVEDNSVLAEIFINEDFSGDMLFAAANDAGCDFDYMLPELIRSQEGINFKNYNDRVFADIEIEKFSFNELRLRLLTADSALGHCFLYYADAYHPHWSVYVNGEKAPLIKSNIGYKSVMIPCGESEVVFKFGNWFYKISIFCYFLLSISIISSIIYFMYKGVFKNSGTKNLL